METGLQNANLCLLKTLKEGVNTAILPIELINA